MNNSSISLATNRDGQAIRFIDLEPSSESFEAAVLEGLSAKPKRLSPKFFYDRKGSAIFDEICRLEEYYPTRTEMSILTRVAGDIAAHVGPSAQIVEFGAGSLDKVRVLIDSLEQPSGFVALDISGSHLRAAAEDLQGDYPALDVVAIAADYSQTIDIPPPKDAPAFTRLGFFPGSTIGNFTPDEAVAFMRHVGDLLGQGAFFLVGTDLIKDRDVLEAAYDDKSGVTARFNKNLLHRMKRELKMAVDPDLFDHKAVFNEEQSRVEMHLVSTRAQTLTLAGQRFDFDEGETIHTENSYKFTVEHFQAMADDAGMDQVASWQDELNYFALHLLKVR